MLHQYYKDIIYPDSPDFKSLNGNNSKDTNGNKYKMWKELEESFKHSHNCKKCCPSGNLKDFTKWKSTDFLEKNKNGTSILTQLLRNTPFWKAIQFDQCLCPFVFGYWGLHWSPSCAEATAMLMGQACGYGTDVVLKLSNATISFNCHSFLLHKFRQRVKTNRGFSSTSKARLILESGLVIVEMDYIYYSIEIIQFIFYSAYGHTFLLNIEEANRQTFTILHSLLQHLVNFQASICKYLIDIPSILTNIIIILEDLIASLNITDSKHLEWIPDIFSILNTSSIFKDIHDKLVLRLTNSIQTLFETNSVSNLTILKNIHGSSNHSTGECFVLQIVHQLLIPIVYKDVKLSQSKCNVAEIDSSQMMKLYLAQISELHESTPFYCFLKLLKDFKLVSGMIILLDAPCSDDMKSLRQMLCEILILILGLIQDDIAMNIGRIILKRQFTRKQCCQLSYINLLQTEFSAANEFWQYCTVSVENGNEITTVLFQKFVEKMLIIVAQLANKVTFEDNCVNAVEMGSHLSQKVFQHIPYSECDTLLHFLDYKQRIFLRLTDYLKCTGFRELRSVAYSSYSAEKYPRMKSVVQLVAIVFGNVNVETFDCSERLAQFNMSAEGRKILCSDKIIKSFLQEFHPMLIYSRSSGMSLLKMIEDLEKDSQCDIKYAQVETDAMCVSRCPDHSDFRAACVLWNWFSLLANNLRTIFLYSKSYETRDEFCNHTEKVAKCFNCFFSGHWTELCKANELSEPEFAKLSKAIQVDQKEGSKARLFSRLPGSTDRHLHDGTEAHELQQPKTFILEFRVQLVFHFNPN